MEWIEAVGRTRVNIQMLRDNLYVEIKTRFYNKSFYHEHRKIYLYYPNQVLAHGSYPRASLYETLQRTKLINDRTVVARGHGVWFARDAISTPRSSLCWRSHGSSPRVSLWETHFKRAALTDDRTAVARGIVARDVYAPWHGPVKANLHFELSN